jgi:shikimate kinase
MTPIILIGPPGAGKTSIGRALAKRLMRDFQDTDAIVEQLAGKTIPEIFLEDGEDIFRALEKEVVLQAIKTFDGVLSLGGGSVLSVEVQEALKDIAQVVYLEVSISNAAPRIGFNRDRPLLLGNPRAQWLSLLEKRKPIYESLAKVRISTDNKKVKEVVDILAKELAT